jgi:hypothetical protein
LKEIIIYGSFFFKQEEILGVHGILSNGNQKSLVMSKLNIQSLPLSGW